MILNLTLTTATRKLICVAVLACLTVSCSNEQQAEPGTNEAEVNSAAPAETKEVTESAEGMTASPKENPLRNAYFGETHMHTAFSLDAYIAGTRINHDDAYRFARGEEVSVNGKPHQRKRPLDFVAISDHAEYIGEMYSTMFEGAPGHDQDLLEQLRTMTDLEERQKWFFEYVIKSNRSATPQHPPFFAGEDTVRSAWQVMVDSAQAHNQPGEFTHADWF